MNDYYENFKKLWATNGGLITQKEASRLLNKSDGRIAQMITEKKLRKIDKYVSFAEVCRLAEEDRENKQEKNK